MSDLSERVERYLRLKEEALSVLSIGVPRDSFLYAFASDCLDMARRYFSDAEHFHSVGDDINALSAINYAYGWIDAGVRLGVLDGKGDHRLFTHYR